MSRPRVPIFPLLASCDPSELGICVPAVLVSGLITLTLQSEVTGPEF